jgi:hypothetical protein
VRDATFAEDASRIRKNPDISRATTLLRLQSASRRPHENIKNARSRAALDINHLLEIAVLY